MPEGEARKAAASAAAEAGQPSGPAAAGAEPSELRGAVAARDPSAVEPGGQEPEGAAARLLEPDAQEPEPEGPAPPGAEPEAAVSHAEEPQAAELATQESPTVEPSTPESRAGDPDARTEGTAAVEPSAAESGDQEPAAAESGDQEPAAAESGDQEPAAAEPDDQEPAAAESGDQEPSAAESGDQEPSAAEPDDEEPAAVEPDDEEPGTEGPATPEAEEPRADAPAEEPGPEQPGEGESAAQESPPEEPPTEASEVEESAALSEAEEPETPPEQPATTRAESVPPVSGDEVVVRMRERSPDPVVPGWTNHNQAPPDPQAFFPCRPPEESIGPILSATSSHTLAQQSHRIRGQAGGMVRNASLAFPLGALLGVALAILLGPKFQAGDLLRNLAGAYLPYILICGGLAAAVAIFRTARGADPLVATFVGQKGLARYLEETPGAVREEVLPFAAARRLNVMVDRQLQGEQYVKTLVDYSWGDGRGNRLFEIGAAYHELAPHSAATHAPIHFGRAAEAAWTEYRRGDLEAKVASGEPVRFGPGPDSWIQLEADGMSIGWGGDKDRISYEDLEAAEFSEDRSLTLRVYHAREGLFADGDFRFKLGSMPDFQVFRICLERKLGVADSESPTA